MDPASLQKEDFEEHVGSVFQVTAEGEVVDLKLEEVTGFAESGPQPAGGDDQTSISRSPFALSFSGPKTPLLWDCIYRISHPEMGELEMFLKPYQENPEAFLYEAVFN